MGTIKTLSTEETLFFTRVYQAVQANPFSDERVNLDIEIAGLYPEISSHERITRVVSEVRFRINQFEKQRRANINQYKGQDKIIFQYSILFDFFHLFLEQFDAHIEDQILAGESPAKVSFADDAVHYLQEKGFDLMTACHYFSLCFQLRRAYYFIDRGLTGNSTSMIALKRSLWNNVFTNSLEVYNQFLWNRMEDFSTLILGETGSGKGAAATAIGRSGYIPFDIKTKTFIESFTRSFIAINLSQYPENLIESELFGHKKGAFTGAISDHKGLLGKSSPHGAIFLDEIGEVSIPIQIKLLKVLEERLFCPVGSHTPERFKGRIIAATNRPAEELTDRQILRKDFYYRLCSDLIRVPPLRQRIAEDQKELDSLLEITIERILGSPSPFLVNMVRKTMNHYPGKNYPWPGNVREFAQFVRRILLNQHSPDQNPLRHVRAQSDNQLVQEMEKGTLDALSLSQSYCHYLLTPKLSGPRITGISAPPIPPKIF